MWNGWIIGILGVWAFIAPFTDMGNLGYSWSHWIVGAVCAILGFAMVRERTVEGWVTGILGAWMFVAGFIGGLLAVPGVWWNNLIVGAVLAVFGFAAARSTRPVATTGTR
jgi:hypothetical protein